VRIYEDLRVVRLRLSVLQYGLAGLLALLLAAFWHLQVLRAKHFRTLAESNRIRTLALAAPRGHLLDRTGRTLVENRPSFNIILSPEDSPDLERTVVWLSRLLGLDEASLRARAARHRSLRDMVVKTNASLEEVAVLEARRFELPAVTVAVVPLRSYPLAAAAAHTLGRVGEVQAQQLHSPEFADLKPGDLVGQAGIEALYNSSLMGRDGLRRVIVDSLGLEVGEAERRRPEPGPNLTLTLDSELQAVTERAFAGRAGAAVVLDPNTGAILAMTSTPAYDPNEFTTGIDTKRWATLRTDPATPLMNRVIQGQYAPGSIFKIVVAAAALEEGLVTPRTRLRCSGVLWLYDTAFHCNVAGGHGRVALREALAHSCNVYFYRLGVQLGIQRIARYARRMGLGDVTRVDLPHEVSGLVPSPEWKLRTRSAPWYEGETVSVSIGQGQLSVTPLQAARLIAVVASGGQLPRPYLVAGIGGTRLEREPPRDLGFRAETLEAIKDGLCAAVAVGTGSAARPAPPRSWAGQPWSTSGTTRGCWPTPGSWPSPPQTVPVSPWPSWSRTVVVAARPPRLWRGESSRATSASRARTPPFRLPAACRPCDPGDTIRGITGT